MAIPRNLANFANRINSTGDTPAQGSNTQIQFNSSGVNAGSANLTFDGTGISTGNVNVSSATNPSYGMYLNSTASSGLSFYNTGTLGGSSAMQVYYGRSSLAATTNGVANSPYQWYGFGKGTAPNITIGSSPALYTFTGSEFLITDVPYQVKIVAGGRGDNTGYNCPEDNGVLYVAMNPSDGGNGALGRNGIYVTVPRLGLGDSDANGIKVLNKAFGNCKGYWSLLKPDDPNGGGTPVSFYSQIDTSTGPNDNSSPVGLVINNATTDNYSKTNGGAALANFYDRRSGSTSRNMFQFFRNTTSNQVGTITTTNSATSYNTTSDYRLKENVAPMTGALQKVSQLKPVTYTWKIDGSAGQGFIAHELQSVIPQAVTGVKDEVEEIKDGEGKVTGTKPKYQSMDTSFLVATLTAAIQELKAEVDALKAKVG